MIDNIAVHEAGHFIYYLIECHRQIKLPCVNELIISPRNNKGHISVKHDISPEYAAHILSSDIPDKHKDFLIQNIKGEIKFSLSGGAAEIINMCLTDRIPVFLSRTYKLDKKDSNSDINKAIIYNVALGNQTLEEGTTPLIELMKETIQELSPFWNDIENIATILDTQKRIEGCELVDLIDSFNTHHYGKD